MRSHVPLSFPATRKALWSHQPVGGAVTVKLPTITICLSEQVLYLTHGHSRSGRIESCYLCGDLVIEPDCSEIKLNVNQLISSSPDLKSAGSRGKVCIPTKLTRKSRHEPKEVNHEMFESAQMALDDYFLSNHKIDLSQCLSLSAECTVFTGSEQIHCDVEVDSLCVSTYFTLTPIDGLNIATTALSKSLFTDHNSDIFGTQRKFGYLTMDQFRKVVLLLDSDPQVVTRPIIGIWVSGVDLVTDPFIWAACARFIHTKHITDKVNKSNEPFLLIHKSPISTNTEFYDCQSITSAITYKIHSGFNSLSFSQEMDGKRDQVLSVRLQQQAIDTVKGRKLAEYISLKLAEREKENRKTPKAKKHDNLSLDELPRQSPLAYKPLKESPAPTVPDLSMLEECTPSHAPKPARLAFHNVTDSRLNCSPHKPQDNHQHHHEPTARKIIFNGEGENNIAVSSQTHFTKSVSSALPMSPSLRSPQFFSRKPASFPKSPSVAKLKPLRQETPHKSEIESHDNNDSFLKNRIDEDMQRTEGLHQSQELSSSRQPPPVTSEAPKPHVLNHAQSYPQMGHLNQSSKRNPTSPLSIITDNVQRLLSPRVSKNQVVNPTPQPIYETPANPAGSSSNLVQTAGISPEVQQILSQQDDQLKALQHQIQRLLKSQEERSVKPVKRMCSIETQTSPRKCTATVSIDVGIMEQSSPNEVGSSSQSSLHDSSQSHSLIQHDLTNLDLPTQLVARSFASDINVDYESYSDDESHTNSPRGNDINLSGDSWQSPVLGESVSMLAHQPLSAQADQTKLQLDGIIKNVQDMLRNHMPKLAVPRSPDPSQGGNVRNEKIEYDPQPEDVEAAAKIHFHKLGIQIASTPTQTAAKSAETNYMHQDGLPKVQYVSMMLTDSFVSDTNRSMEMNTLALKYLQDEQLTELAQLTLQKQQQKSHSTNLLRQVLTLTKSPNTSVASKPDMSFATKEYLKRYALAETSHGSETSISSLNGTVPAVLHDTHMANTPKSILKKPQGAVEEPQQTEDNNSDQDTTIQVLDIARLRELPKLL